MEHRDFNWEAFFVPYQLAIGGFIIKLEAIKKQYSFDLSSGPIEIVSGRVKSISSILEKADRLNIPFEKIPEKIYDIAGIRITCKYIKDVYRVFDLLKARKDIDIFLIKDYIANPKPSGYRSLHVIAKYNVETINGQTPVNIEFQIRTHSMHLWASIEHSLKYKYYRNIPNNILDRLLIAAEKAYELDEEMSKIKDEIDATNVDKIRNEDYSHEDFEISVNSIRKW